MMRPIIVYAFIVCVLMDNSTCAPGGWKVIPLGSPKSLDSIYAAARYIGGHFPAPALAQRWFELQPNFDIYKVDFIAGFRDGITRKCQTDVLWTFEPLKKTTFNIRCNPPWSSKLLP
ncbi:insoluble matrix shell protein 2-like [Mercenaria mercenaria]|uniref:insoluble matrix shell protein 2-like n=1 Tax=Mercenaria mercenaria TaxID=6596 RepID=UPI00234E4A84|nr:insoluble matrix shell protein 2-like [Mercenaria mercenaria]